MDIHLTAEESTAVLAALRNYVSELRMEIVDTDNPEFKRGLRDERAQLEAVVAKLDGALEHASERDDQGRVVVRMIGVWAT